MLLKSPLSTTSPCMGHGESAGLTDPFGHLGTDTTSSVGRLRKTASFKGQTYRTYNHVGGSMFAPPTEVTSTNACRTEPRIHP